MIAERILCTDADLRAGFRRLGLGSAQGDPAEDPSAWETLARSDLTDEAGALTGTARVILPLLARPQRVVTVSAVTVGSDHVDTAVILAAAHGGPFVLRGDRDGMVDLVVLDSATAVAALLDGMMLITGIPTAGPIDEIRLDEAGWLGLLAATDAVQAARLEQRLARAAESEPTFDRSRLASSIVDALGANDSRWVLGAMALVDRPSIASDVGGSEELTTSLVEHGLAQRSNGSYRLTGAGIAWAEALNTAVRISHVRFVHMVDGVPVDIIGMTYFRSPTAILSVQRATAGVELRRSHPEVAVAELRAALDAPAEETVGSWSTPSEPSTEWAYVVRLVEVRGLHDTSAVVGTLQPGTWYALRSVEGDWARVATADGSQEGWAPLAQIHLRSELEGAPAPDWAATHTVPDGGLPAWARPDPASETVANLPPGVELEVVERRLDWANVRAENGWRAWVDERRLIPIGASAPVPPAPPVPAASGTPDGRTSRLNLRPIAWLVVIGAVLMAVAIDISDLSGATTVTTVAPTTVAVAPTTVAAPPASPSTTRPPTTTSTAVPVVTLTIARWYYDTVLQEHDGEGGSSGFEVDLVDELMTRLHAEADWVDADLAKLYNDPGSLEFDLAAGGLVVFDSSLLGIAYSAPYLNRQYALIVDPSSGSSPTSFTDLSSSDTVGVTAESVAVDWAKAELAPRGVTVREFDLSSEVLAALRSGEVDAIVSTVMYQLAAVGRLAPLELVDALPTGQAVALVVDPDQPGLLANVNETLAAMISDGTYQTIYDRWFDDASASVAR